ncbi:Beta-barrel assembly machine subunit BamE [Roseovarius azorensis]|uniref:Beta-barrel assembly machine subunit BamE n=1 Tax=Roseovarius azorensis TaxID=1287727 RepID=A0A1H7HV35_9RHOB|nr:outer membrane protein assembly factor BamE [Roseovarius azorensis]SEK52075.1 Beta-barrel assembly machine subunit BamE [Roseovarius azorensis]
MTATKNRVVRAVALCCLLILTACSATYRNHGYVPPEEDLENLVVGVDSRATVDDVIGAPSASGMLSDGDYYYVRSRIRTYGMYRPEVVERQVLAISFNDDDTIANIERFSLADGQVVPLARRVTDSSVVSGGFLRQLLGNIGNINPEGAFGS